MKLSFVAAAAVLGGLAAQPALATEWLICGSEEAAISLLLGSAEVLNASAVTMNAGDKQWASSETYGEGAAISMGQGYQDDEKVLVDILDENYSLQIAHLRVFKADIEGGDIVYGGVLEIVGEGAWAVSCEF
jgi:hypothetical protein